MVSFRYLLTQQFCSYCRLGFYGLEIPSFVYSSLSPPQVRQTPSRFSAFNPLQGSFFRAYQHLQTAISVAPLVSQQNLKNCKILFQMPTKTVFFTKCCINLQEQQLSMKLILLCLSVWILAVCQPPEECKDLVENWRGNASSMPEQVAYDSGKFPNDLGDYNDCLFQKTEGYTYITMSVKNKVAASQQYVGMCIPNECVGYVLDPTFAQNTQDKFNKVYQDAKNTTFQPFANLHFINPVTDRPTFQAWNYVVLGLFLGMIVLGIAASIVSFASTSDSKGIKVLKAFSMYDNFKKIVTISQPENENLVFLNGMRVFSICWVILGHDEWFRFMNIKNWVQALSILTTPGLTTLAFSAYFAVDVFFWIGGFLLTITLAEKMVTMKKFSIGFFLGLILHRFIRIWPTYMVAILFFWKLAPLLFSGPIWPYFSEITASCDNGGVLWNVFFIDNFGDHGPSGQDYCFGWGWYLSVDFQLFLITPFIFYAYAKNKKLGFLISFLLFFASVLTAFILVMVNDWRYPIVNPKLAPQPQFMDKFYYKPYIRASAYMMGLWSGMFYNEWKDKNQKVQNIVKKVTGSLLIRTLFYLVGIGLISTVVWVAVPYQRGDVIWSTTGQAFYNSLNRVGFLVGIMLVTFPAMFGCKNDPCHIVLGSWIWSPVAKVSFCMYLVHFIILMMGVFSNRMDMYWQYTSMLYAYVADVFWTIILATLLSVMVESPILGIEKILMRGGEKKKEKAEPEPKRIEFVEDSSLTQPLKSEDNRIREEL